MHLTQAQLEYCLTKVLKPQPEKMKEYRRQVANLREQLQSKINEDSSFGVIKYLQAGSFRKGTVLRPRGDNPIDIDIALFLKADDATTYDLDNLHEQIRRFLIAIYPTKASSDFEVQPRTLGIVFRVSGLCVDVVPIIPDDESCDYGLQPSSQGDQPTRTSVQRQLDFIRARKQEDAFFTSIVRFAKFWKNEQELKLSSFAIELIVSHIQIQDGSCQGLEQGILRFFLYLAQHKLNEQITFGLSPSASKISPIVILDPTNSDNNITQWTTEEEKQEIIEKANQAFETLSYACAVTTKGETIDLWKEVFGRSFKVED